jgi:multisubunit Na+/H+ antiporter MnhB subunit
MEPGDNHMTATNVEPNPPQKRSYLQKLWVPVVLLVGLVAGEVISLATTAQRPPQFGCGPFDCFHPFPTDPLFEYHVILTTVEVVLLISLVVIYCRMYAETKAIFALGLVVVLAALLLQALVSYPITDSFFFTVTMSGGSGYSIFAADVVTVCAYTVFLYLSLE